MLMFLGSQILMKYVGKFWESQVGNHIPFLRHRIFEIVPFLKKCIYLFMRKTKTREILCFSY